MGQPGGVPTRREDVGEHDVVSFFLFGIFGQDQAVIVTIRNAQKFGLAAIVGSHIGETICGPSHVRYVASVRGGEAICGEPALAVGAKSTGDVKGQYNAVAHFHAVNSFTNLDDLTQVLMTANTSLFHIGATFIHMKVRTTDI